MPVTLRRIATVLMGMTLISHVLLTIRDYSGSTPPIAKPDQR